MRKYFVIVLVTLALMCCIDAAGQNVTKKGNNFTQVANQKSSGKETKTAYTFTDSKGNSYPIYLSSTGKAFIKKVSKNTGKEYRQYIPEIGKQINPEAYKDKK